MQARRTIVFLMIIIISTGLLTYINIAKDAEPDIDIPFIYVVVPHQGISPEDSEIPCLDMFILIHLIFTLIRSLALTAFSVASLRVSPTVIIIPFLSV